MSPGVTGDSRPTNIGDSPSQIDADLQSFDELEQIGAGGNADVSKAAYDGTGPDVCAIKQPRMNATLDSSSIEEFTAEAETWEKLDSHDHIVGVLDHGQTPLPWIALEYMDGGSLQDRLDAIETAEALWTGVCIAQAVRHAHRRGIAHLDLKPENVLFTTNESSWDVPKVTDWGLAKMLLEHSQSVQGLSPQYAAPEQFDSEMYGPPDDYTDIYAAGAVVYASLVGEPPFTGSAATVMRDVLEATPTPPSERVEGLPEGTDEVVLQALEKQKDDRYESILDFRRKLETLVEQSLSDSTTASKATPTQVTQSSTSSSSEPPTQTETAQTPSQAETTQQPGDTSQQNATTTQPSTDRDTSFGTSGTPDYYDSGRYLYASLLFIPFGSAFASAISSSLAGLCLLGGIGSSIYFWNKDMINVQHSAETDWTPRRYLYFAGILVYGISILVYLYKRKKAIGLR